MNRGLFFLRKAYQLIVISVFSCVMNSNAGLVIDNALNKISWVGDSYGWAYFMNTGNWSWVNVVDLELRQWNFDATAKLFSNQTTGESWQYDDTYDVWVNSESGLYDVTTESLYSNQAWRFDATTKKWRLVTRSFDNNAYTFSSVSSAYWHYDTDTTQWQYSRTVSGDPIVPIATTWTFNPVLLVWQQLDQGASDIWQYIGDFTGGQWLNVATAESWLFRDFTDGAAQWAIVGDDPGVPYDVRVWTQDFASGLWTSSLLQLPATETFEKNWQYDGDAFLWHDALDAETTKTLLPMFPPTPLAHYKAVIDSQVNGLLTDGVMVGSSDGTGNGFLSDAEGAMFNNGLFVFQDMTKMTFTQTITLSGDVELRVDENAVLTIGDGITGHSVTITPSQDATEAQLIFNVSAGKTLEIELLNDCYFKAAADLPLYVSFRGRGRTVFRMPSGRTLSFGPLSGDSFQYGVHAQVLMDLTENDVASGVHQVVFEPWSYVVDSINTRLDKTTWIRFGSSSTLRFFSSDEFGIDGSESGFSTIAFDVCHAGSGRMIVDLAAGHSPGDRYDAGINLWGSLIVGTGENHAITNADLRTGTLPHKRAGVTAFMSIVDDLAFDSLVTTPENPSAEDAVLWVSRDTAERRGLVIINRNRTYPYLAANLAGATSLQTSQWAISQKTGSGYQPGFIMGDNGQIRIAHNLFLDYVAGSATVAVSPVQLAGIGATTSMVKYRNPSSFIIDGIGQYSSSADAVTWDMLYSGGLNAMIVLEGTSGLFFRSGASAQTGVLLNDITVNTHTGAEALDATIGNGLYDGVFCPVLNARGIQSVDESIWIDSDANPIVQEQCLDGEHVLDIERKLSIISVLGKFGFAPNGYINIPSISIDYTGREKGEVSV